ncbi:hypothetical protein [Martelella alba]|uniref:Tail tube protein n=1 Tax=Martelella alba TaxID=2590451 RepID=A0ABY2SGN0_9HYPH|nr:hypothetical protein [Martelella alba]TKI02740.1 hypothetical protein FCN80_24165 [Martelella alba]
MPSGNPLISQGFLNRVKGTVAITDYPELNVTASYLGKEGISIALEGNATTFIDNLTGRTPSPEPYMAATITIHLNKSQALANSYKSKMESDTTLGDITVTPDSTVMDAYSLINCAIVSVAQLTFNGTNNDFAITIGGTYVINNDMWS